MAQKKDFKKNPAEMFISGADSQQEAPQQERDGLTIPKGYRLAPEPKSDRMQLLIKPTLKAGLKAEAQAQGLSMNDLANRIFEDYLKERGTL